MREILFRGKNYDGEWFEGLLVKCRDGEYMIDIGHHGSSVCKTVIPETIGQYTGLEDINGKKIFEGDIVNVERCDGWNWAGPATYDSPNVVVEWNKGDAGFHPYSNYDCDCGIFYCSAETEIIGNIHDNPELLKEKKFYELSEV